jgi:hypothetical protein
MPLPGQHRASFLLLLVLAAGLAAAGAAAAANAQETACCPAGMESTANGCTWLGAGDCCPERPAASAPSNAAAPAPATLVAPTPAELAAAPATLPTCTSHAQRSARSQILRL